MRSLSARILPLKEEGAERSMNPKNDLCAGVERFGGGSLFGMPQIKEYNKVNPRCKNEQRHVLSSCPISYV